MNRTFVKQLIGVAASAVLFSSTANAGLIVHTTLASWEAAIAALGGSTDATVDFNGFGVDASFATSAVDAGPFSLEQIAGTVDSAGNKIDVSPFEAITAGMDLDGSPFAAIWAFSGREVMISFDSLVLGFGGDVDPFGSNVLQTLLTTDVGDTAEFDSPSTADTFLGVTVTSAAFAFSSATWSDGGLTTDTFGFDNVVVAGASASDVPEPATLALMGLGLAGLGYNRKRKAA